MEKWEVLRIFCDYLPEPHDKFSICICPERNWFFWIDSEPPFGRRAREVVLEVPVYWASHFLRHPSYVDTTKMRRIPNDLALAAWNETNGELYPRRHGRIITAFRDAILAAVETHEVLNSEELAAVRE